MAGDNAMVPAQRELERGRAAPVITARQHLVGRQRALLLRGADRPLLQGALQLRAVRQHVLLDHDVAPSVSGADEVQVGQQVHGAVARHRDPDGAGVRLPPGQHGVPAGRARRRSSLVDPHLQVSIRLDQYGGLGAAHRRAASQDCSLRAHDRPGAADAGPRRSGLRRRLPATDEVAGVVEPRGCLQARGRGGEEAGAQGVQHGDQEEAETMRWKGARTEESIMRGRNSATATQKFVKWNSMREGRRHLSCASSVYWYFDSVFCRNWKPIARYIRAPGRADGGVFVLWDEWFFGKREIFGEALLHCDSVCAGLTPDMVMPADAFLENVRRQYLSRGRWLVERFAGFQLTNAQAMLETLKSRVREVDDAYAK